MYLLDTNIIGRCAPGGRDQNEGLIRWLDRHTDDCFISVVTVAELQHGAAYAEAQGHARVARALKGWISDLLQEFGDRILDLSAAVALGTGEKLAQARKAGHEPQFEDAAIAATAQVHGLTVLTANTRHFLPFDVPILNPDGEELPERGP